MAQVEYAYNVSFNRSTCKSSFQIVYGMHPRGVHELRDLGLDEKRSADGEEFIDVIHELHKEVKQKLQSNNLKYKARADLKHREVNFEEGDLVMVYLKKDRFPRGIYNKLKWKNIGLCKILRKFFANAYEVELPRDVGISPIFNVPDLYPYRTDESSHFTESDETNPEASWKEQLLRATSTVPKIILDKRVCKKTQGKEYYEYLIKWKDHPVEDLTWMIDTML